MGAYPLDKIRGLVAKASPLSSDSVIIADSEDNNKLKSVLISDLPSSGGAGSTLIAVKTLDTAVSNDNTTWNDDAQLILPLDANSNYAFEILAHIENEDIGASHAATIKCLIPSGATGYGYATIGDGYIGSYPKTINGNTWDLSLRDTPVIANTKHSHIVIKGSIVVGSTAGSLQFSWRPKDNDADPMTLLKGSYIKLIKET